MFFSFYNSGSALFMLIMLAINISTNTIAKVNAHVIEYFGRSIALNKKPIMLVARKLPLSGVYCNFPFLMILFFAIMLLLRSRCLYVFCYLICYDTPLLAVVGIFI